jgi:hypothetical protein
MISVRMFLIRTEIMAGARSAQGFGKSCAREKPARFILKRLFKE